jgi:hypothetical protein
MAQNLVDSLFFLVTGTMFFPPLAIMRLRTLLNGLGFWSWVIVFFVALGFDGAYMHPFCLSAVGLLLVSQIFEWNWKKLSVFMALLALAWGFIINWWTLLVVPLVVLEAWADEE